MALAAGNAQTNSAWSKVLLGLNTVQPNNIGNLGCLVTAWGNMLWWITENPAYTPLDINNWMKANDGFVNTKQQPNTGIFIWSVALGMGHVTLNTAINASGTTTDLTSVNNWLAENINNYAILQVVNSAGGTHFVFAPKADIIVDSEDGKVKPMNSYPFTMAHLYTATVAPIEPAVAAPVVDAVTAAPANALNEDNAPMTADQETTAYVDILNRQPDGAVPSGRTAYQFILDAKGELSQERANQTTTVTNLQSQVDSLSAQVSSLTATNVSLSSEVSQLKTVPNPTAVPVDFKTTWQPFATPMVMTTTVATQAIDYAGVEPAVTIAAGTVFSGDSTIAGTFTADGVALYRTTKSFSAGQWYGVPQSAFVKPNLLSVLAGLFKGVK